MSTYNDGEVLAITYDVSINGAKIDLSRKQCINSIDIKETVDGSSTATIDISDPDLVFIEDDIYKENNEVTISLGWSNSTDRLEFIGFISAVDIDFPSDGVPKLKIHCSDGTQASNSEKKDQTYENTTSAEIIKQKCAEYGWTCIIEDGYEFPIQETITQSDQTDLEFMISLASSEVYPFSARLDGTTFYYVKKGKLQESKMSLTYRNYPHEIISFSPRINNSTKESNIESATMDTSDKELDSASTGGSAVSSSEKTIENGRVFDPVSSTWSKTTYTK